MEIVKNKKELCTHGNKKLRKDAIEIVEAGITSVIPLDSTKKLINYENGIIKIGDDVFYRKNYKDIYVIGAGKGSFPIAEALDSIFGSEIKEGFVAVKQGEKRRLKNIDIYESSHPLPDERSVFAGKRITEICSKLGEDDLVFLALTGGSSAIVNYPCEDIDINCIKDLNEMLLNSGADISKINTVRKHLDELKGGGLLRKIGKATVITITFDTAPDNMPWPDLVLADPTTFEDAINILKYLDIWNKTDESIRRYLVNNLNKNENETLKNLDGFKQFIFSVADPRMACNHAYEKAVELGYNSFILSTKIEGEASELGQKFSRIVDHNDYPKPCCLISGGETTVTIKNEHHKGGPNQETSLGFAASLNSEDAVCICVDTDGTDGPTDLAGGLTDFSTKQNAINQRISIEKELAIHNSSEVLEKLHDAVKTGNTGTNVMNLRVVLIGETNGKN